MASTTKKHITVLLNYEEINTEFNCLVEKNSEIMAKHPLSTNAKIQEKIRLFKSNMPVENDLKVLELAGVSKLYRKRDKLLLEVLSVEEAFDIILRTHVMLGHTNPAITYKELSSKYFVPTFAVSWLVSACNVCHPKKKPDPPVKKPEEVGKQDTIIEPKTHPQSPVQTQTQSQTQSQPQPQCEEPSPSSVGRIWRLNLVKHSSFIQSSNGRTCYLLILRQVNTNFLLLRPVFQSAAEFALDLLKIFTEFGYPEKVYVHKTLVFFKHVLKFMQQINPVANIIVAQTNDCFFFENDEMEVVTEINKWMKLMDDVYWDQCCHIVQYKLNKWERPFLRMDTKEVCTGVPFNLFFNFEATRELTWIDPKTNKPAKVEFSVITDEEK